MKVCENMCPTCPHRDPNFQSNSAILAGSYGCHTTGIYETYIEGTTKENKTSYICQGNYKKFKKKIRESGIEELEVVNTDDIYREVHKVYRIKVEGPHITVHRK